VKFILSSIIKIVLSWALCRLKLLKNGVIGSPYVPGTMPYPYRKGPFSEIRPYNHQAPRAGYHSSVQADANGTDGACSLLGVG